MFVENITLYERKYNQLLLCVLRWRSRTFEKLRLTNQINGGSCFWTVIWMYNPRQNAFEKISEYSSKNVYRDKENESCHKYSFQCRLSPHNKIEYKTIMQKSYYFGVSWTVKTYSNSARINDHGSMLSVLKWVGGFYPEQWISSILICLRVRIW